ncbi:glycosyltransferase [Pontibacter arcticus]|uniref:Glycosyl transferase n=1 Tax=Pontibacter arcticus TaxID=2080288 RepID=A0A364RH43_9BACT|nr:glycosyltransferase [Pontibacter arcticus]RAU83621.1 glycosyl transferase [Pontibacter arcticus]
MTNTYPLVSIVCLCYNHARFLPEALDSVLAQTYPNIEIIVVDDESTDESVSIIQSYLQHHPQLKFISTGQNKGNCAAFNMGWRASQGAFIIDFSTDDVLLPDRVAQQVETFQKLNAATGVVYTDAEYITDNAEHISFHSQKYKPAQSSAVFSEVIARYFICPPTMMIRREVFEKLGGYDETLAYEDFDFWVRSARNFGYHYLDIVTTKRRVHEASLSQSWYAKGNRLLASTVKVCEKIAALLQTETEREAYRQRLKYEARHAYFTANFSEAESFFGMLAEQGKVPFMYKMLRQLNSLKINLTAVRKIYYQVKH